MSMYRVCRVFSCVVGRGCLLWPVRSFGKTLLAFALLHSVFQGQICLLLQVFLGFLLLHSSPLWWKGRLFWVLVLKGLVGLHSAVQLQLLRRYWLEHKPGLLWHWVVCLGDEERAFCRFWDCIQVPYFACKMVERRMCAHLLLRELQNYNFLLNNHWQKNVGSQQKKKIPKSKGKGEAPARQEEEQNRI